MHGSARLAWTAGAGLFALEALQVVVALPLLAQWLMPGELLTWLALVAGWGLVNATAAAFAPALTRGVARTAAGPAPWRTAVSTSAAAWPVGVPSDWARQRRHADRIGCTLLLLLLAGWAATVHWPATATDAEVAVTLALFGTAMAMRLSALNRFALLNGLGLLGRDKAWQLGGGALAMVAMLLAARAGGGAAALAGAWWLGAALLPWLGAARDEAAVAEGPARAPLGPPTRRQWLALWMLNVCGQLNLASDIVVASRLLPPPQAVAYAFWSRLAMLALLPLGLMCQTRFPAWVRGDAGALRIELRRLLVLAAVLPPLLLAAVAAGAPLLAALPARSADVPIAALAAMAVMAGGTIVAAQLSLARGAYQFVWPSAAIGALAPLLGWAAGWLGPSPQSFVAGYVASGALLWAVNVAVAWRALDPRSTSRAEARS